MGFEVVGFAGFGVGVEDEVDAVAFLWTRTVVRGVSSSSKLGCDLTFAASPIHLLASSPSLVIVVIMQNLQRSMKAVRSCTFSGNVGSSRFLPVYGSAVLPPVSVLEKDILSFLLLEVDVKVRWCCSDIGKRVSGNVAWTSFVSRMTAW